ncbi:MAG TPA: nucleotide disphospho-sugar-binding domain-containing protein, partial [Flavisolibacter sp.]|nr:nucleotide disphospho-sugar-binding domain-containing protein [Flavisolibacter sp.]
EYKRSDISSHIKFVGPLLPFTSKKEGKKWHPEILRRYQKVILVTQGTVERDIEKIIVPTLEAFKGTNQLVVVTTGGAQTNELKNRYPHANILIEDFIPFDEVMPHADVYITNGGYGGVLMAIQHELPMVVAGVHEGKNEINARIGYFQLGINLKTEKPTPDQLRQAVLDVLLNDRYSHHIQELNKEFSQYHPQELSARYIANLLKNRNKKTFMKALDTENIY